jgi:deoxyribonuclease-4
MVDAVEREVELGGNCGQIFVGSPRGWAVSEVDPDEAEAFQTASADADVAPWSTHGTYLINLATPKDDLGRKSLDCVQAELDACSALEVPYYVFHPGSHTGAGREQGVANIAERIGELDIPENVMLLLENTAGKGTTMGVDFAELDAMVEQSDYGYDDVGVCLDTCHLYAAGYDFTTEAGMQDLVDELDATVGIENVHYLHLNDSKHPLGSEKDEHAHIGLGEIGEAGFRHFINHDALRDLPMVLETPEEDGKGYAWNVEQCRSLRE